MKEAEAISALGALAQEDRLAAFRLLVKTGPDGMASGDIAAALTVQPTRMSFHLSGLERAGLVSTRRDGRRIVYAANFTQMRSLLGFLTEDCCCNLPEICGQTAATFE